MTKYIAKCNKVVSCIYGTRQLVEGLEVPEIFARRFPQYVNCITIPDPVPVTVEPDVIIIDAIEQENVIAQIKSQLKTKKETEK